MVEEVPKLEQGDVGRAGQEEGPDQHEEELSVQPQQQVHRTRKHLKE